jgi:hypothetical protein
MLRLVVTIGLVMDIMRGIISGGEDSYLNANAYSSENTRDYISLSPTGFKVIVGARTDVNTSGNTYIYIAIRRPMKVPESGTEVYTATSPVSASTVTDVGLDPDWVWITDPGSASDYDTYARLMGPWHLSTADSATEVISGTVWDNKDSFYQTLTGGTPLGQSFKRAAEFFDVVCYEGTGSAHTEAHNLTVVPELMIVKSREPYDATGWSHAVYYGDNTDYLELDTTIATTDDIAVWNDTSPTATVFTVGTEDMVNKSGTSYIACLFATLDGVSKVGTYTADATLTTIDCGFTTGARFILIKRTDSTGDWYQYDYTQGIVAGNDPYMRPNVAATQVTGTDYIDPDNSGFQITAAGSSTINVSGGTYIYLAIA